GVQYPVQVVPGRESPFPFGVVAGPEPGLDRPAETLERARGGDPLRGTADAHQHVRLTLAGGVDRTGDVAVGDEPDPGAGVAYLLDELGVPGPVEDADRHVGDPGPLHLRDAAQVLAYPRVDVDHVDAVRADRELLHVEDRTGVEHRAAFGDRQHGHRVGHALGHQRRTVDRVHGDVDLGPGAVADLLAVVEHRRVVLL